MGFETALVKFFGAGLSRVGCGLLEINARPEVVRAGDRLVAGLAARPEGQRLAGMLEELARELSLFYRAHPRRVEKHAEELASLLGPHGPRPDEIATALGKSGALASASHRQNLTPATQLAVGMVRRAAAAGDMRRSGLEDALSQHMLEALFDRLFADLDTLESLAPKLRRWASTLEIDEREITEAEELEAAQANDETRKRLIGLVARLESDEETPIPRAVSHAILTDIDCERLPDEQIIQRVLARRPDYLAIKRRLVNRVSGDPAIVTLSQQAAHAVQSGHLDVADQLLAQAEKVDLTIAQERPDEGRARVQSAAESRSERGCIEELRYRYRAAADHYAAAAEILPRHEARGRWQHLISQAKALARQEREFGDLGALSEAVGLYDTCTSLRPAGSASKEWAVTQCLFGGLIVRLGERLRSPKHLRQGAGICLEAADQLVGRREPYLWAATVLDRATALASLGELDNDVELIREAVTTYRDALGAFSQRTTPDDWASTQLGLARCMNAIAAREQGVHRLVDAISCARLALQALTPDRHAVLWGEAQLCLGVALSTYARRSEDARGFAAAEQALYAARSAAQALTSSFRGKVHLRLAEVISASADAREDRTEEALQCFETAISSLDPSLDVEEYAGAQFGKGQIIEAQARTSRAGAREKLEQAIACYRNALAAADRKRSPHARIDMELALGRALFQLGQLTHSRRHLSEALVVDETALQTIEQLQLTDLATAVRDALAEKNDIYQEILSTEGVSA
jgi:tetratricopeptide (TPR) repeat protein